MATSIANGAQSFGAQSFGARSFGRAREETLSPTGAGHGGSSKITPEELAAQSLADATIEQHKPTRTADQLAKVLRDLDASRGGEPPICPDDFDGMTGPETGPADRDPHI